MFYTLPFAIRKYNDEIPAGKIRISETGIGAIAGEVDHFAGVDF